MKSCKTCKYSPLSKIPACIGCNDYSHWESKQYTHYGFSEKGLNLTSGITPSYYNYSYKGLKLDPYRVAEIYEIKNNMQFHIFKKVVRMHKENHKDLETNLKDIIKTAERWLEMIKEDEI